jgi:hypothetical protein
VRISPWRQEKEQAMRIIRRRNWLIKRIALGLAIAAFAAPVAQASVDEGIPGQPNAANESFKPIPYLWPSSADKAIKSSGPLGWPGVNPSDYAGVQTSDYRPFVTDFPSYANVVDASDYGMPRPTATDYAISRGDLIEVVRSTPNAAPSDKIEFVRTTQPRSTGEPQVVAVGFDWKDAGIGAGLALALVLLGGGAVLATRHVGRTQTA